MKRLSLAALAASAIFVTACGGTAAPTQTPAGGTPTGAATAGATPTPGATVAGTPQATPPPVGGGSECAPYPTLNPASYAPPSFTADPALEAVFPTQIDGSAPENLQSGSWLAFICYYGGQADLDKVKAQGGNSALISALTFGSADYTVNGDSVTVSAFRVAGTDANQIIQNVSLFVAGAFGQTPQPFTTAQQTIGGKSVYVLTDSEGKVTYAYVKGDVVISVSDVDADQAAKIFAALP